MIVSAGTRTVTTLKQPGNVAPMTGQVLPGAGDVMEVLRALSPVSGSLTVTEPVMVTVAPTAMSPVHRSAPVGVTPILPELVTMSPL
ncbi:hypothetical protein ACFQX6_35025 [Streptosporangium lutulentum]